MLAKYNIAVSYLFMMPALYQCIIALLTTSCLIHTNKNGATESQRTLSTLIKSPMINIYHT